MEAAHSCASSLKINFFYETLTSIVMVKRLRLQWIKAMRHAKGWKSIHMISWWGLRVRHYGSVVAKSLGEMRRVRSHMKKRIQNSLKRCLSDVNIIIKMLTILFVLYKFNYGTNLKALYTVKKRKWENLGQIPIAARRLPAGFLHPGPNTTKNSAETIFLNIRVSGV